VLPRAVIDLLVDAAKDLLIATSPVREINGGIIADACRKVCEPTPVD
jgi:hypothetical protein